MSDKVGSNESHRAPKLVRDVLLHHQTASEQVLHDKTILEALKASPNLLGLIGPNGGASSTTDHTSLYPYLGPGAAVNQHQQQQQQLATTAALDIFAYCQYISSMMLFKAMSQGESPLLAEGGGGEDKSPASSPTSPDIPQD